MRNKVVISFWLSSEEVYRDFAVKKMTIQNFFGHWEKEHTHFMIQFPNSGSLFILYLCLILLHCQQLSLTANSTTVILNYQF